MPKNRRYRVYLTDVLQSEWYLIDSKLNHDLTTFVVSTDNVTTTGKELLAEYTEHNVIHFVRTTDNRLTCAFAREDGNIVWYAKQWSLPHIASNLKKAKRHLVGSLDLQPVGTV